MNSLRRVASVTHLPDQKGRRWSLIDMLSRDIDRIQVNRDAWIDPGAMTEGGDSDPFSFSDKEGAFRTPEALPILPTTPKKLPFNVAVAPLLTKPTAPFEKTEQKKAMTSAKYYSECYLSGVPPKEADQAASEIQGRFNKWWGRYNSVSRGSSLDVSEHKLPSSSDNSRSEHRCQDSHKRKRTPAYAAELFLHIDKKRRLGRGKMRDIIEDNTLDPYYGIAPPTSDEKEVLAQMQSKIAGVVHEDTSDTKGTPTPQADPNLSPPEAQSVPAQVPGGVTVEQIKSVRDDLVDELRASGGDTDSRSFQSRLTILQSYYALSDHNMAQTSESHDGVWLTLSKPTYPECLGRNELGQYIYTLGRMSFDMFRPANLVCSIQGVFNSVYAVDSSTDDVPLSIPGSLRKEVLGKLSSASTTDSLRTHNIVVAFTIEPTETIRRPIRGIMTNYGYALGDPDHPNRTSIWFTGGTLEVNDEDEDLNEWRKIFNYNTLPRRDVLELARVLAAKVLLGAETPRMMASDGTMTYSLSRPIGGHGAAYCDLLYMDESIRIMRGHHGSIFVNQKVSSSGQVHDVGRRRRVLSSQAA